MTKITTDSSAFEALLRAMNKLSSERSGEPFANELYEVSKHFAARLASTSPAPDGSCVDVLLRLADQFDEMANAAYSECEYDRRDVWENAASQARTRARQPDWIAAPQPVVEKDNG